MRWALLLVACVISIAACTAVATTSGTPSAIVSATPSASSGSASGSPAPATSTAEPSAGASDPPAGDVMAAGGAAITVVDGVRVRSTPSVDDAVSRKYVPLLPRGTALFVLDGPTAASGYDWWHVVPTALGGGGPGHGWVAGASREGEPWLQATQLDCPPTPTDLGALKAITDGIALACFAGVPITVRARLVDCECDITGPRTDPDWLGLGNAHILLVDPSEHRPPPQDRYLLHLDPAAGVTSVPIDQVAEVTGIFDHPDARECRSAGVDEPSPVVSCRSAFAVTALKVVAP